MTEGPLGGRRLLVLGAGPHQVPLIRAAQRLGCHVVAIDNRPEGAGHRLADAAEVVSTIEPDAVLEVARRHAVHGVLTYGSDVSVPAAAFAAERCGLPGNPPAAARLLQRKDLFRAFQREAGLPHPPFAAGLDAEALAAACRRENLEGPLVIKPADASGSKGQTVIGSIQDLPGAFDRARPWSRCGVVIAERYLTSEVKELVGDALVRDGRIVFRHYGYNYFLPHPPAAVPVGEVMPLFGPPGLEPELDRQLTAIVDRLGLRTGAINFDGLLAGGQVHILDIGLRAGGNYLSELIRLSTGFDLTAALVFAALGEPLLCPWKAAPHPRPVLSYLFNVRVPGVLEEVQVDPALRPYVAEQVLFVEPGHPVLPYTQGDRAFGVVLLAFPDIATQEQALGTIEERITVRLRS